MELTIEEIDLILSMNVYEMDYARNPKSYDSLKSRFLLEREKLVSLVGTNKQVCVIPLCDEPATNDGFCKVHTPSQLKNTTNS